MDRRNVLFGLCFIFLFATSICVYDLNKDNRINWKDYKEFSFDKKFVDTWFGGVYVYDDFNGDRVVDNADRRLLLKHIRLYKNTHLGGRCI